MYYVAAWRAVWTSILAVANSAHHDGAARCHKVPYALSHDAAPDPV